MSLQRIEPSARVGLVGLGIMGAPIARRLSDKGFTVTAWNLEPERYDKVRDGGVAWAGSPAEVWNACDVALVCVLGDDAIESVVFGAGGFVHGGEGASVLVDLSTTSPAATAKLADRLDRERGVPWVDAPMSGGPGAALEGGLTLMVGGDVDVTEALEPLFEAIAANVTRMGETGAGQMTKILNQAIVGVNYVLMAELLTIAKAAGIDPGLLPECLKGGMADSTILQRIYPQMSDNDFDPPRSYVRQVNKDLVSVTGFVTQLGLALPVIELANARYRAYAEAGNQMEDGASVSRLYEPQMKSRS